MKIPVPEEERAIRAAAFPDGRLVERRGYSDCFICGKPIDLAHACWAGNGPCDGTGLFDLPCHRSCAVAQGPVRCSYLWQTASNAAIRGTRPD